MASTVRVTRALAAVLREFLEDTNRPQYGYALMKQTGFSSAKTYKILKRLENSGWIERAHRVDGESGGPPRVSYRIRRSAVPLAQTAVTRSGGHFDGSLPIVAPQHVNQTGAARRKRAGW
ncbi:hypothetical protein CH278_13150 [Rhodococcus sp. 05-2254-5]|uniref:PadR family transcriptional regulator n=1 Tax=unclassified Rhodococcus (in: high G+C Gram-positive bacteria) TaxID=192944 RepID=UPI000B9C1E6D|nr:hypothetical protein CH278_13150 [Rhodococcus sp. 05-2254-5]OZE51078.1 hypothetical protein CH269_26095 [Rhodococcus sp. 05-2254-1]